MRNIFVVIITLCVISCGCGKEKEKKYRIINKRSVSLPSKSIKRDASSEERFTSANFFSQEAKEIPLQWQLPEGWRQLPSTSMRLVHAQVERSPETICYVAILPENGGGVHDNINRWRQQMCLPPLSPGEVETLPKKALFGREAYYVELEGTFRGMRGEKHQEDYGLLGMILEHERFSVFVKMVGPKDILVEEKKSFSSFCSSLVVSDSSSVSPKREIKLSWKAPDEWKELPKNPMRLVTYRLGKNTECYIAVFPGRVGGITANVNRWYKQMGQEPIDHKTIHPTIKVLEQKATYIELYGTYIGMNESTAQPGYIMLGVICPLPEKMVFIKLIGPEKEGLIYRDAFTSFCQSLHQ